MRYATKTISGKRGRVGGTASGPSPNSSSTWRCSAKEIVEPQRCPVLRCDERCVGRPVTRGGAGHSSAAFFDDRAVPVIEREPRESLAELFGGRRDLRQQRHHVIADEAGDCPASWHQTR